MQNVRRERNYLLATVARKLLGLFSAGDSESVRLTNTDSES